MMEISTSAPVAMEYFCPHCFESIPEASRWCPHCRKDVRDWHDGKDYAARLVRALQHPIDQVRMGAIITLGNRADPGTAPALAECAYRFPGLVPQNLQIIESLMLLPDSHERKSALEKLSRHPSHPVAERARDALGGPGRE